MIVITTIAAFLLFLPDDLIEYGKIVIYTLLFGGNFRLAATPGYFHHSMQENPLLHMWSLSVEEQFYLTMANTSCVDDFGSCPKEGIGWPYLRSALSHSWPRRRSSTSGREAPSFIFQPVAGSSSPALCWP